MQYTYVDYWELGVLFVGASVIRCGTLPRFLLVQYEPVQRAVGVPRPNQSNPITFLSKFINQFGPHTSELINCKNDCSSSFRSHTTNIHSLNSLPK